MISEKPTLNPDGSIKTVFNPNDYYKDSTLVEIQRLLDKKANTASPVFTGSLNAISGSFTGALSADGGFIVPSGKNITLNGNIIANTVTVTPTTLSYLDATSSVQTQLNNLGGALQSYVYMLGPAANVTLTQSTMARLIHILLDKNTTFELPLPNSLPNGTRFSFYTYSIGVLGAYTLTLTSPVGSNRFRDVNNVGSPSGSITITSNAPLVEFVVNTGLYWRIL
jgi:hypothetical protein